MLVSKHSASHVISTRTRHTTRRHTRISVDRDTLFSADRIVSPQARRSIFSPLFSAFSVAKDKNECSSVLYLEGSTVCYSSRYRELISEPRCVTRIHTAAPRLCSGPTVAIRAERTRVRFPMLCVFFSVLSDSHRGERANVRERSSRLSLFDVS